MNCEICIHNKATIKHHISYFPEVTTGVCEPCHGKIHSGKFLDLIKKYVHYQKGDAQLFYRANDRIAQFCMELYKKR